MKKKKKLPFDDSLGLHMPSVDSVKGAKAACRKETGLVTLDLELTSCSTHCSQLLLCVVLSEKGVDQVVRV
jgi:hypothetical protein